MLKKLAFRILAFVLDLGLASLIVFGLSSIRPINPDRDELNKNYKTYFYKTQAYENLSERLDEILEDKIIDKLEMDEINIIYRDYADILKDIEVDKKLKSAKIEELKEEVNKKHLDIANGIAIKINKLNIRETIISFVVYILYFGVLQYILNGQTPFKRVFRIKVLSNNGKKVSLLSYLVRAVLVTEMILSSADLITLLTLEVSKYINVSYWFTQIKYIYEMAFLAVMIIRDDNRSIDDLILNTKVIRYDKEGKEIVDPVFVERTEEDA